MSLKFQNEIYAIYDLLCICILFLSIYVALLRIWKEMSLNDSLSVYERAQLAVWDYPVSDRYTKMWQTMKEAGLPKSFAEAIDRVRASPSSSEGYAFLGSFYVSIRRKIGIDVI